MYKRDSYSSGKSKTKSYLGTSIVNKRDTQIYGTISYYPIYLASRELDVAEMKYTNIEREGPAMILNCKNYKDCLLENYFKFYIDHYALLYLVNKTCTTRRTTR